MPTAMPTVLTSFQMTRTNSVQGQSTLNLDVVNKTVELNVYTYTCWLSSTRRWEAHPWSVTLVPASQPQCMAYMQLPRAIHRR